MNFSVRAPGRGLVRSLPGFRVLGCVVWLLACGRAEAQEIGARLRIQTPDQRLTGTLAARSADTLFLEAGPGAARHSVPIGSVVTAEESLGRVPLSREVARNAKQLTIPFTAAWIALGLLLGDEITPGYVAFGVGLGAATGAVVGLTEPRRERWRAIEVADLRSSTP